MSIRRGDVGDLELTLAIQHAASLAGLGHIFPPDRFPYPVGEVREGLREQLEDPRYITLIDAEGRGFTIVGDGWLQRLYVRQDAWGSGLARDLHDAALAALRQQGAASASLWCLAENARARRFYERHGWRINGDERVVPFPPHPLDVGYSIPLVG
jgi:GNAT superfamily N-acetyltransferase